MLLVIMTTTKLHNSEDWWVSHDLKKTAQLRIDTDMYKRHKQRSHIVQQRIRIVQFGQPRAKTFTSRNTETIRDAKLLYVKAGRRSATPVDLHLTYCSWLQETELEVVDLQTQLLRRHTGSQNIGHHN